MRRIYAILLFVGCIISFTAAQQPPPPPPPPAASQPPSVPPADAAAQNAAQQGAAAAQQATSTAQQATSAAQQATSTVQQQGDLQQQIQQQQQQIQQQQQQIQQLQQQLQQHQAVSQPSGTTPTVPTQTQQEAAVAAANDTRNLPQADKMEAQRAEAQRIEAQKELDRIQAKQEIAELRVKDQGRLRESRATLQELLTGTTGKVGIPNALIRQAKCVAVIPAVKKGAFGFGAKYGRGVMTCRLGDDFNGPWSAPAMYALEGANFGFQVGLSGTDLVLLIMNPRGADSILKSKVKLGGDMSIAAGPIGRNAEASTDLAMRAKILSYSRSHGIFAGVALDGATLRPDNKANEALYGREISAREIVRSGATPVPTGAVPLLHLLDQSARASADNKAAPAGQAQAQPSQPQR